MSLIRASRCLPLLWIVSSHSIRSALSLSAPRRRRSAKPIMALRGVRISWLMLARNEARARLAELGPQRRFFQLGGPLADLAFELFGRLHQGLFGPLALGDVEGDALQKQRPTLLVADDAGLAVHPNLAIVAGDEPVLRAEIDPETARAGELRPPPLAVVGMQLAIPEERIAQPFLLREAEHDFDLRAHVDLVVSLVERGHEGDGRNSFDERPVAGLHPLAVGNIADSGGRQGTAVPFNGTQADLDRKFLPVFAAAEKG